MITEYNIIPGVGALPVRLGMTMSEVEHVLGAGCSKTTTRTGNEAWHYPYITIEFVANTKKVYWIAMRSQCRAMYNGSNLFDAKDPHELLSMVGQDAQIGLGYIFFPELCVACDDFESDDRTQSAVCVFQEGTWKLPTYTALCRRG